MNYSKGDASEILDRLSSAYGVNSQKALAEALGVPAANVSNWLQRNSVPGGAFVKCSLDTGADLRWLSTGEFEDSNNQISKPSLKGKELYDQILNSGGKAVLQRILQAYGFKTQKELSDLLGIPTGTISTWIRRDFFPGDVVVTCALDTGVSLEWLCLGDNSTKKKSSSVITQKSAKYHVLKKFSVLSGDLIDIGTWVADVSILTSFNDSTIYVEKNGVAWLVDLSVKKITNGFWLININGVHDIYLVKEIPGMKIRVTINSSEFICSLDEIKLLGLVKRNIV
ncbi:phage repressor protein CI [Yersinia enterocolitica]|uniref:phage repressor protein CI n=1 Tax=Yersinia enterocolitica TaxID=630 RepID=UPI000D9CED5E|nr:phage repressor protein CI [Yersinia enterocolitica]SQA35839.1 CI repressor of phage 186 and others [Yersinia enterocolitica]SUP63130.1 CI repressor of phage 186 and others [Yersinia enterocolitica]